MNDRVFLNNVSLGIYGDAVRQPGYRDAKTHGRADCRARAVVLVSNNPYSFEPQLEPGTRPSLGSGRLGIVVLDRPGPGRTSARTWTATELEVTAAAPVHAGIDGEAVELSPTLRFALRPLALRMRLPRP